VRVENGKRRRTAKGCRGFVTAIEKVGPGDKREDAFPNDVRAVGWMHESKADGTRDLLPGVRQWLDVAATIDGQKGAAVLVSPAWRLETPGDYIFSVLVTADEADPVVVRVKVHWEGTWSSLSGQRVA
jgi:hypothetical protein